MDEVLKTTDYVTCPYEPNHRMRYSKFHNHFVKCKAAHPDDPREPCPYYASELIHPDEMKDHLLTCKYRNLYSNSYYETTALPVYDTPCHFNLDERSGNESDDDVETAITVDRDDRSSLFSATTRSYKTASSINQPICKLRRNNFNHTKPAVKSYAFEYIDDEDENSSTVEVLHNDDSGNYSWRSSSESGGSFKSPKSQGKENEAGSAEKAREINSPVRPFERKIGLGRGKLIQRLLSSSSPLDSFEGMRKSINNY